MAPFVHTALRIWAHLATRISVTLGNMALQSTSEVNALNTIIAPMVLGIRIQPTFVLVRVVRGD